jgi:transcriptional regulator with XRE-family HTH domain
MPKMQFSTWFLSKRKEKGLTQMQAAEQLGLSSPTISRWEDGTEPRAGHLIKICKWGSIKPDALVKMFE